MNININSLTNIINIISRDSMGYLICDECAGYYELQEGEYPDDFDRCECGGNLEYVPKMEKQQSKGDVLSVFNTRKISGIIIGAIIMLLPYLMFSPSPYSPSFVFNSNIPFFIWGAAGLIAALIAGGNIRSGASNGFYSATISGLAVIIYYYWIFNNYFTNPSLADNLAFFGALCVVYILAPAVFSVIGGLIVGVARKILTY